MPKPKGNEVKINYRSVKVAILEVKQLTKIYGTKKMAQEVLRDINMSIEEGEFIAIMGPSGSGKTTLLNVLSSIDYISQGSITLKGKLESFQTRNYLIYASMILVLFFKSIIYCIH